MTRRSKHENMVTSYTFKDKVTPLNDSDKVGGEIQGNSDTYVKNWSTLGERGPQFQPAPESGQASGHVSLNPTYVPYVREEKVPLYVWYQKEFCKEKYRL